MTKLDVAGILTTYAEKIARAQNNKQVKDFVRELKRELDLRKLEDCKNDKEKGYQNPYGGIRLRKP